MFQLTSADFFSKIDLTEVKSDACFNAIYSTDINIRNFNILCGITYKQHNNIIFQ